MKDASEDYGKKVSQALAAVRRMHADVSKLLVDADATIGRGKTSAYGNIATRNLTRHVRADYWMAEGVFRVWVREPPDDPTVVDALTVLFFAPQARIEEPYLLVGQIKYRLRAGVPILRYFSDGADTGDRRRGWHLWVAYTDWAGERRPGVVLTGGPRADVSVDWFKVIGVPLYTISKIEDVTALMEKVRAAPV